jgi:Aspartyl protease/PDZ domain
MLPSLSLSCLAAHLCEAMARRTSRIAAILLTVACAAGTCVQAAADPPEPRSADAEYAALLLSEWKQAAGGAAWDSVRSVHLSGVASQGGLRGPQHEWTDLLNGRYVVRFRRPPLAGADGFDGRERWTEDASGRAWVVGDRESREAALTIAFQRSLGYWYPARNPAVITRVPPLEAESTVDILRIAPVGGRPFDVWLDARTHLPVRLVEQTDGGRRETTFDGYRSTAGVMLPFAIRTSDGDPQFAVATRVERYEFNVPTPASRFRLPRPPDDFHLPRSQSSTTVPFTLVDGHIHLAVYVNDRGPFDALLDTGGQASLAPQLAQEVGIRATGAFEEHSSSGVFTQAYGAAESLRIGDAVIKRPVFSVFQQDNAQILLGHEVFQRFAVRVDSSSNTLTLTLPQFLTVSAGATAVPFRFHDRMPEIDATVDGFPGVLGVDSGQSSALDLNGPFVAEHGLVSRYHATISATAVGVVGQSRTLLYARIPGIDLAGLTLRGIVSFLEVQDVGAAASRYVDGYIGQGLLKRFTVTYDYSRQQLLFEPTAGFDQPDTFSRSGLWLAKEGTGWRVARLLEHGPGEAAGLRVADFISAIDGMTNEQLDFAALARLTRQPVGTVVSVTVQRDSAVMTLQLVLRDVL